MVTTANLRKQPGKRRRPLTPRQAARAVVEMFGAAYDQAMAERRAVRA